jgi:uncharacterized repeat protein (TIGR01451 family)
VTIRGTNLTDLISVRFGSTPSAFTNSSPNEIIATVPSDASTATISVTTAAGIVATPTAFVIVPGAGADLGLIPGPSPASVVQNEVLTYLLSVTNQGPSVATNILLSDTLSPKVLFQSATASAGSVTRLGQEVQWQITSLANGEETTLNIAVLALQSGAITNQSTVSAASTDPNLEDNSAIRVITALTNVAVLRIEHTMPDQVRLFWPVVATGFVAESRAVLGISEWNQVIGTPVVVGNENMLTTMRQAAETFYRLRKP